MMLVLLLPSRSDCLLQFSRWQAGMQLTRNQTRGERVLISCEVKGHSPSVNSNSSCLLPVLGCCAPDCHIASCLLVLHIYAVSAVWWSLKSAYKYLIPPKAEFPVFLKRLIRCCYALLNILIWRFDLVFKKNDAFFQVLNWNVDWCCKTVASRYFGLFMGAEINKQANK